MTICIYFSSILDNFKILYLLDILYILNLKINNIYKSISDTFEYPYFGLGRVRFWFSRLLVLIDLIACSYDYSLDFRISEIK